MPTPIWMVLVLVLVLVMVMAKPASKTLSRLEHMLSPKNPLDPQRISGNPMDSQGVLRLASDGCCHRPSSPRLREGPWCVERNRGWRWMVEGVGSRWLQELAD